MPINPDNPRYTGVYTGHWLGLPDMTPSAWAVRISQGRPIGFSRLWRGHLLSMTECRRLMAGGSIRLDNPREGEPPILVALGEYLYHGQRRCGVSILNRGDLRLGIPDVVNGVRLTVQQRRDLLDGRTVHVTGLESSFTKRRYDADLRVQDDDRGREHLIIEDPVSWPAHHTPDR